MGLEPEPCDGVIPYRRRDGFGRDHRIVRASVARAPYQGQAVGDNVRGGLPLDVSWLSGLTAVTR